MRKDLLAILISCTMLAASANEPLDSVYRHLEASGNTVSTSVKYSGGFKPNGASGFIFQRADGSGWTAGNRLTLKGIGKHEVRSVFKVFDDSEPEVGFVVRHDSKRACFDEAAMTGYAAEYDSVSGTLHFLRVDVEDEICIPSDWTVRDNYYVPSPRSVNWQAALGVLHTELRYNSPFYEKNRQAIDSVYYASLEELRGASDYESFLILEKAVAACNDGHTYLTVSNGKFERAQCCPFSTVMIGDKLYVNTVESDTLRELGLRRGMEIVSVDSEPIREYGSKRLRPYVSASTPQWADHEMFDNYGFSYGRAGTPMKMRLVTPDRTDTVEINYIREGGIMKHSRAAAPELSMRKINGNIAVLTIPDFSTDKTVHFFDSIYPALMESSALIIDLRGNGGGNSNYADHILRHLTTDSIDRNLWSTPMYLPAFASWGYEDRVYESGPQKMAAIAGCEPYLNPVVILTDRGTFSSAEDFCATFKGMNRGLIVGTPTGGSTGNGVRVMLTKGIGANICSKHDRMPDGREFVGVGIIPDIIVEETPESYFSGTEDIVLEKAIQSLITK
ncbi:MAG: hypothetical protein HDR92_02090 [Bacteroides sp.]|nr:hypothetical protein [Bacteroides sp.]